MKTKAEQFKRYNLNFLDFTYRTVLRKIFFLINPELIHEHMLSFGESLGSLYLVKKSVEESISYHSPLLKQKLLNLRFNSPIGLAAGFDYEAKLTQLLSSLGFGFGTVGTITNMPYVGNPKPRLGRLPKSQSLMVNKGFKNIGAKSIAQKLEGLSFQIPVGISIGRTNSPLLETLTESIKDTIAAFATFEDSKVKHSYYELNISCPNLIHSNISFYPPRNLRKLLSEVDKMRIKRPILIKMPIEKDNREVLKMLEVITNHCPKGVIFGNLQKDRSNIGFDKEELKKFPVGNFSGKPTFERSNELIKLAYRHFKDRFIIIGCGGVFDGKDAFKKISLGASLVQLITGLIFKGPQLVSQINLELTDILKKEGFSHISEAIGVNNSLKNSNEKD